MKPEDTVIRSTVRRQVLARLEDREQRRLQARDLLEDAPRLRAGADRLVRLEAVAADDECLPIAVGADRAYVGSNLVKTGKLVLARQEPVELGSDQAPLAFNL